MLKGFNFSCVIVLFLKGQVLGDNQLTIYDSAPPVSFCETFSLTWTRGELPLRLINEFFKLMFYLDM